MAPSVFSVADTAHRTVLFPPRPARALRYWTPSDRARLAEAFGAALRGWQEQWGLPHGAVDVRCAPPTDVPGTSSPSSWTPLAGAGGVWWAVAGADPSAARPMDPLDAIAWAMLRARNTEAVAARVGAGPADATGIAWGDLERSLASSLGGASRARCRPRLDEALRPWSGALVAAAPWCGGRLLVLCDDEWFGVRITERSDALERLLDGGDAPAAAPSAAPAPVSMAGGCESPE